MATNYSTEENILARMRTNGESAWLYLRPEAVKRCPALLGNAGLHAMEKGFAIRSKDLAETLAADFDLRPFFWFGRQGETLEEDVLNRLNDAEVRSTANDFLSDFTSTLDMRQAFSEIQENCLPHYDVLRRFDALGDYRTRVTAEDLPQIEKAVDFLADYSDLTGPEFNFAAILLGTDDDNFLTTVKADNVSELWAAWHGDATALTPRKR